MTLEDKEIFVRLHGRYLELIVEDKSNSTERRSQVYMTPGDARCLMAELAIAIKHAERETL